QARLVREPLRKASVVPMSFSASRFMHAGFADTRKEMNVKKLISAKYIRLWLFVLALSRCVLAQVVPVSNVEELYTAVNNPANAGATLVLAPGTYWLSATDPNNVPRPNGGRIEFQTDMSIMGVEGDRSLVVINASGLPASSFPTTTNGVATGPNGAVRM